MTPADQNYKNVYKQFLESLSPVDRAAVLEMDRQTELIENGGNNRPVADDGGIQVVDRKVKQEPDAFQYVANEEGDEMDIISRRTPLDELLNKEDLAQLGLADPDPYGPKVAALAAFLSILFANRKEAGATPLDVLIRLWAITYLVAPNLIQNFSIARIAQSFDVSTQKFSREILRMNNYGLKGRNQKRDVSAYRENSTQWRAEKRAKELKEKRKRANKAHYEENKSKIIARIQRNRSMAKSPPNENHS